LEELRRQQPELRHEEVHRARDQRREDRRRHGQPERGNRWQLQEQWQALVRLEGRRHEEDQPQNPHPAKHRDLRPAEHQEYLAPPHGGQRPDLAHHPD
jgi:hypothetical protein